MEHYIPAYTRINGVRQQAACGAYVFPNQHSTTPNCEQCLDYLTAEAATDAEMEALAAEPVDRSKLVSHSPFYSTAGYRPKGQR